MDIQKMVEIEILYSQYGPLLTDKQKFKNIDEEINKLADKVENLGKKSGNLEESSQLIELIDKIRELI